MTALAAVCGAAVGLGITVAVMGLRGVELPRLAMANSSRPVGTPNSSLRSGCRGRRLGRRGDRLARGCVACRGRGRSASRAAERRCGASGARCSHRGDRGVGRNVAGHDGRHGGARASNHVDCTDRADADPASSCNARRRGWGGSDLPLHSARSPTMSPTRPATWWLPHSCWLPNIRCIDSATCLAVSLRRPASRPRCDSGSKPAEPAHALPSKSL